MATIYELTPLEFSQSQGEKDVFAALSKLGDQYYIFYSINWLAEDDALLEKLQEEKRIQGEADFVIFDSSMGILLVIEVKGGFIRYDKVHWLQTKSTGKEKAINPVKQANASMHYLRNKFEKEKKRDSSFNYPSTGYAVWFPSVELEAEKLGKKLPSDCTPQIVLDKKSLGDVERAVSTAFDDWRIRLNCPKRCFSKSETEKVVEVIAPIIGGPLSPQHYAHQARNEQFIRMTGEQSRLMDSLDEQKEAVIKGYAGTGKTVLAIKKARRLSESGEAVLFLCVTKALKEYLRNVYCLANVDFHTFDSLSYLFTNNPDFLKYYEPGLADVLSPKGYFHKMDQFEARKKAFVAWLKDASVKLNEYPNLQWKYKHLVIDEGQDFQPNWLDALRGRIPGSFYVFCDLKQLVHQNQLDQREQLDSWFSKAQCTFSLITNCRNTLQIAKIAYDSVNLELKDQDKLVQGNTVKFYESKNQADTGSLTGKIIEELLTDTILSSEEIVVLTMGTIKQSTLKPSLTDGRDIHYILSVDQHKIPFTTVRMFKGLEAEAVILTDVSLNNFLDEEWRHRFYVGCSRAKHELHIIFQDVSEQSIDYALEMLAPEPDAYFDFDATRESLALVLGGKWCSI